jgi:alpha-tubulin suppressor-like RCC1 family protein
MGGLKCWGDGLKLGDASSLGSAVPVAVSGLSSGVIDVVAGSDQTCAVTSSGAVKCWGENAEGALGDGTMNEALVPVNVVGLSSGVVALAAGTAHTCALTSGGGVKCWGENYYGQVGDGTTTRRLAPVDVVGLSSGVAAITSLVGHTCALLTSGGVKCWGLNSDGQLGDGTKTNQATPVSVTSLSSGVAAVRTGGSHSCMLMTTGGVKCWGNNMYGQLGDGTTMARLTPVNTSGSSAGISAVGAGLNFSCALSSAGGVSCWGSNDSGVLGDGSGVGHLAPVAVSGLSTDVVAISTGASHSCAMLNTGGLRCWGWNISGMIGDGTNTDRPTPVDVVGF